MRTSLNLCRAFVLGCAAAALSIPVAVQGQCGSSFQLFQVGAPRNLDFAFYEPATGRTIAIEKPYTAATSSDTWSWDGAAWHRLSTGTGPINVLPTMVSRDTARNRVVVVNQSGQTYEWDGAAWTQRANCPSTRCSGASTTFDSARGVTLLVSGGTGTSTTPAVETWEWNGTAWTQRAVTGPSNRHLHSLTYDPVRNVSVLIGGRRENAAGPPVWNGEVWEFNGAAWTQRTFTGGPGTIADHCAVYHAALGGVVIYGGSNLALKNQMSVWTGTGWTTIAATTAGSQQDASLMSDPAGSRLMLLGRIIASADGYAQHRWQLFTKPDASGWVTQCRADDYTPNTGYDSAACYDSNRGVMVVFGGVLQTGDGQRDGTTWEFNGIDWHKSTATGPAPRSRAMMVYDSARHRVVMVGGMDNTNTRLAELWEYDGTSWTLASTDPTCARVSAAIIFDPARGLTLMNNGTSPGGVVVTAAQTWNGSSWTPFATSESLWGSLAFDTAAQAVIGCFSAGTYRLDSNTWTQLSASSLPDLFVYDAGYGRPVGYQGVAGPGLRSFNGTTWQLETVGGNMPAVRTNHSILYDARRGRTMIYGGYSLGYYTNEIWDWVRPTADMGGPGGLPGPDGHLDNNDFIAFINHFFNNSPLADVGKQGGVFGSDNQLDNNDFIAFINLFFDGCGV